MSGGAGRGATFWTAVGSIAGVAALVWGVYTFAVSTNDKDKETSDFSTTIPYPDGTAQSPKPHPLTLFTGTWTGDIVNFNPSMRYEATLVIAIPTAGQMVGTSSYRSLECRGDLRLVSVSDKVLRVEELITEGKAVLFGTEGCINGFLTLELRADGRLFFRFTEKNNSNAPSLGEGFLIRMYITAERLLRPAGYLIQRAPSGALHANIRLDLRHRLIAVVKMYGPPDHESPQVRMRDLGWLLRSCDRVFARFDDRPGVEQTGSSTSSSRPT